MFTLISLFLIIFILIFLLIYKKKYIFNRSKFNKKLLKQNIKKNTKTNLKPTRNKVIYSDSFDNKIPLNNEKAILKKEMLELFKGSKDDKIKALKIAEFLSDKSTLSIIKLGLKDMDSDIVKICAKLIQKFK